MVLSNINFIINAAMPGQDASEGELRKRMAVFEALSRYCGQRACALKWQKKGDAKQAQLAIKGADIWLRELMVRAGRDSTD